MTTETRVPLVGEQVILKGTGRFWSGVNYQAHIVDVQPESIKVRYSDGGFKRFPIDKFKEHLVTPEQQFYSDFAAYELDDDHYDPTAEILEQVSSLREEIQQAVSRKDFLEAHRLRTMMSERLQATEELRDLKHKLSLAIQEENFLQAHELQQSIADHLVSKGRDESPQGVPFMEVLKKAGVRAAGGGTAGAIAMVMQVTSLMWMRTTMNYQYRYGTTTTEAFRALWKQGGILRFYRGIGPALVQGPLSRFGDTAANTGVLALFNSYPSLESLPVGVKTVAASGAAALWRIFLMPVDTLKTTMQVEGKTGIATLMSKARNHGPTVFYHGSIAASAGTFAGHFPWFFTYNLLDSHIPKYDKTLHKLGRNAFMGFVSSAVSDTVSNSIRVIKTYRQTHAEKISYSKAISDVVAADGISGLFGRGLKTRILANGLQGIMFSVLWKYFEGALSKR